MKNSGFKYVSAINIFPFFPLLYQPLPEALLDKNSRQHIDNSLYLLCYFLLFPVVLLQNETIYSSLLENQLFNLYS